MVPGCASSSAVCSSNLGPAQATRGPSLDTFMDMQILRHRAFARAGLVGNPSDGYFGKTISLSVRNFWAQVVLYEWEDLELLQSSNDQSRFASIKELARDVKLHGYYGGIRLVKATIKKFVEYCERQRLPLHDRNFTVRYETTIPRGVGLSGSSAIIIATLRCLMEFYEVTIPPEVQPSLALAVEKEELGITAGLQDRVIQVYEGLVYMDFAKPMRELHGYACGVYERLDPALLPPLYLAYSRADVEEASERIEVSGIPLSLVRQRFEEGDPVVVGAMQQLADLTVQARTALLERDAGKLAELINRNFDIRRSIYTSMLPGQIEMVERARAVGASAHFTGSGGAILGTYRDEAMFQALRRVLEKINCIVLKPQVVAG